MFQLLPKLQVIAMQTHDAGNAVETFLETMADKLGAVMEETMQVCTLSYFWNTGRWSSRR